MDLNMARKMEKLKQRKAALDAYRRISQEFPESPEAKVASERIALWREMILGQFVAAERLEDLRFDWSPTRPFLWWRSRPKRASTPKEAGRCPLAHRRRTRA